MFLWGKCNRDVCDETGSFDCPNCGPARTYYFKRTCQYFHVWFVPLFREAVLDEWVECAECNSMHSINVLRESGGEITSPASLIGEPGQGVRGQLGNVIVLDSEAAAEIRRRLETGGHAPDVAVRIEPDNEMSRRCRIGFDYVTADGRDWIGQSEGLTILIDRRDAQQMHGATIRFLDDHFEW